MIIAPKIGKQAPRIAFKRFLPCSDQRPTSHLLSRFARMSTDCGKPFAVNSRMVVGVDDFWTCIIPWKAYQHLDTPKITRSSASSRKSIEHRELMRTSMIIPKVRRLTAESAFEMRFISHGGVGFLRHGFPLKSTLYLPCWRYPPIINWECGWQNRDRSLDFMYLTMPTNHCDHHVIMRLLSSQRCGLLPSGCNGRDFDWLSGKLVASLADRLDILFLSLVPSKTSIIYFT